MPHEEKNAGVEAPISPGAGGICRGADPWNLAGAGDPGPSGPVCPPQKGGRARGGGHRHLDPGGLSLSKKAWGLFRQKECMADRTRFLAKLSPYPP